MLAQLLARRLHIPGIVLLLASGVALGRNGLRLVNPDSIGSGLPILVGFVVAVVLFEGAMNLDVSLLRHQAGAIRRLVTIGALVSALGGTILARFVLGWPWEPSILFGALMIVTGPTVIQPLLPRLRLRRRLETLLAAEAVFGDAIGATVAVVALELALSPGSLSRGAWFFAARILTGVAVGLAGGALLALALRSERWLEPGFEHGFAVALAFGAFSVSEMVRPESGIVAVVVAGVVLANTGGPRLRGVRRFKEQLVPLLLGMLFVLLAADVRLPVVRSLGLRGVAVVALLACVVRPLAVAAATAGTDLGWRERAFLSWMAPRGIVAASVASLFSQTLSEAGITGGRSLRALVFLVIALTVVVEGTLGPWVAARLRVQRAPRSGYLLLGANAVGRRLAAILAGGGEDVLVLDSNPDACEAARAEGLTVAHGSAVDDEFLENLGLADRVGVVAATANADINLDLARRARSEHGVRDAWVALPRRSFPVGEEQLGAARARTLYGAAQRLGLWAGRLERGVATLEERTLRQPLPGTAPGAELAAAGNELYLPLAVGRAGVRTPFDERGAVPGDRVWLLVSDEERPRAEESLAAAGLVAGAAPSG